MSTSHMVVRWHLMLVHFSTILALVKLPRLLNKQRSASAVLATTLACIGCVSTLSRLLSAHHQFHLIILGVVAL